MKTNIHANPVQEPRTDERESAEDMPLPLNGRPGSPDASSQSREELTTLERRLIDVTVEETLVRSESYAIAMRLNDLALRRERLAHLLTHENAPGAPWELVELAKQEGIFRDQEKAIATRLTPISKERRKLVASICRARYETQAGGGDSPCG